MPIIMEEHRQIVDQATKDIFSATCGVTLTEVTEEGNQDTDGVIIALISLVGDVGWSVFISLPRTTAEAVAGHFAGFEIPFDSEDMGDAIGEVTNIFAGQIKALLDSKGVQADISLPSVMRADGLEVLMLHDSTSSRTCFNCDLGRLWTGVVVSESE